MFVGCFLKKRANGGALKMCECIGGHARVIPINRGTSAKQKGHRESWEYALVYMKPGIHLFVLPVSDDSLIGRQSCFLLDTRHSVLGNLKPLSQRIGSMSNSCARRTSSAKDWTRSFSMM